MPSKIIQFVVYNYQHMILELNCIIFDKKVLKKGSLFFFSIYTIYTPFWTKNLQSPGTYIFKHTWDPCQKAITKSTDR